MGRSKRFFPWEGFLSAAFSLFLLCSCHLQTSSPLRIQTGNPVLVSMNDMTFILLPLEITDRGSRTLRIHLRHSLLDLSTSGGQNFRLRGKDTYTYILQHADKPFRSVYPAQWHPRWVNHVLSHKDVVIPAVHRSSFPLFFLYRGRLSSFQHMTIHLIYSYPQTATNDEILLDISPPGSGS
ncbi:MAG: hypothetical protein M1297_07455 [Nitrospirae bacterium]|nr:hypothetical protein [Nitrospirota bacterium]